ncbi:MAG: DUF2357 domain-containing protein [Acidimicrobiaceae bacterium]|nr:DUF2357 domain-containing protein [Acidimicrobiaceae bacterium]
MTTSAVLRLQDEDGFQCGELAIACLPGRETWQSFATLETATAADVEDGAPAVRLLEESDYRYRLELRSAQAARIEPSELFSPNTDALIDGRLRTRRVTGTVRVSITTEAGDRYTCDFEVRSRKLDYETEYRRMMLRLAEESAELVQSAFAPGSFGGFEPDQVQDAQTLYQRFAFLESLLESEMFAEAMDVIRYRPHSSHEIQEEVVDPTRSLKPDRSLARQLTRSTERQPVSRSVAGMGSLPRAVTRRIHVETLDTVPNRFVRFALGHWKALAADVAEALPTSGVGAERGRREAERIEARLDHLLTIPAVAEAGPLRRFPASNTVLHSRAGYREIFHAFFVGDVATSLTWKGGADVFGAGKRDVATLYEYWVFLELARMVEEISGFEFRRSDLVEQTEDGLNLKLRRGREAVLKGEGQCRGRRMCIELWFNRGFARTDEGDGSWSTQMRPDSSLRIQPADAGWGAVTWVHFDAKYRIEHYYSIFDDGPDADDEDSLMASTPTATRSRRDDLRKMHAYRDAIRRTVGAYVLYPGDDKRLSETRSQYHEILPGVGAFVLRPSENGEADSGAAENLKHFLGEVIDHAASQGTSRERARYWEDLTYSSTDGKERRYDYEPALDRPPADLPTLLGFVRSQEHREWIADQRLYNLRADPERNGSVTLGSPTLNAQFVVLYGGNGDEICAYRTTGALFVRSGAALRATGYPTWPDGSGSGTQYLCIELGDSIRPPITAELARTLAPGDGSPAVLTWDELARASSDAKPRD